MQRWSTRPWSFRQCSSLSSKQLHDAGSNILHALWQIQKPTVPEAVFGAACSNGKVTKLLLDRFLDRAPILDIIERMVNASCCKYEVFRQILLDRNILAIDEKLIEAVAGESEALELLSKHDSNLPITEATIVKTTRKVETLRIVLKTRNNVILVTKKIMKAAVKSRFNRGVLSLPFTRLG